MLDSGILLFLGHHLVHMHGDYDADEDANRGHDAQNWHVKNNTALFQSWKYENVSKWLKQSSFLAPVVVISVPIQKTMAVLQHLILAFVDISAQWCRCQLEFA